MAISKIILNGVTQMDVTQDTVASNNLLSGETATGADGNTVTGSIATKTSSDLTASGATVTAPAGYYASAASKTIPNADPYVGTNSGEYYTDDGGRKWRMNGFVEVASAEGDTPGYLADGTHLNGEYANFNAVPANTTVTPSTSAQTVGGANYMMEGAVTVAAMPSGTAGTPTATKTIDRVEASAIVTPSVTNSTGYITGGTKTGTAVTVTAAELVAGNSITVDDSGTWGVVECETIVIPAGTAGTPSASKGSVSNHSVSVTPSVINSSGWIDGGTKTGTAVSVSASELVSGNLPITQNGNNIDVTNYATVSVDVSGGGGSSVQVGYADTELESTSSSISFTGLNGEPTSFLIYANTNLPTSSPANVAAVVFDGTNLHGQTISTTSNANAHYDTGFSKSYSNGTLTVTATTAQFYAEVYVCIYSYGGSAACVDTKDIQVGSGATSITFTGLEDEPMYWSCIFKSDFGTSSGYQRVIFVTDNDGRVGMALDSSAHLLLMTSWTTSYSNGSFTITSSGTNNGGYFHQPGYYQLTYVYDATGNYQSKTVTPTTSQQVVTADSGYDALKKVTVNAMPEMTLPTSASGTSSGTSKATITPTSSAQYLNIPTGYNETAQYYTIAASGGGGGSLTRATTTWSNNSATTTSHQFTGLSGTPKVAFLRCTTQLTRSSSNTYYYIADIFWDGTNCQGNYHLRSNGTFNNVATNGGFSVTTGTNSITFSSSGSRSGAPGSFYNGTYELVYLY